MATLYDQKNSNIRKTWILLTVFLLFFIALGWLLSQLSGNARLLYIFAGFSVAASIVSYWYSDKIVFAAMKAKPLEEKDNRELFHLVENLCITSGLLMPKIYVLPEDQPNAFATGRNEKHAAVAVTVGLLQKLDKVELEGVLAHELSHIQNRDTLLQTIVVIIAGVIAVMSDIFLRMNIWGLAGDDNNNRNPLGLILFIVGIVAAILAPIAATIIQLAISRKREFLADASGALITRYPEGLARALQKIAADANPLRVANNSTAHLFIASPFKGKRQTGWLTKLFMTHPPVEERIAALLRMDVSKQ